MEISRKLLVVYYNNPQAIKKLEKHGNLIYHSNKLKYAYLYIDAKEVKSATNNIKNIKGVYKVEESLLEMEEYNFTL